jgi:hypothetical protein
MERDETALSEEPVKPHRSKEVSESKEKREKKGVLQYKGLYIDDKSDRGHWVPAEDRTCSDRIQKYETERGPSDDKEKNGELSEILGLVTGGPGSAYCVRFNGSSKPRIVTRSYLHKHYAPDLLEWYEAHLQFLPKEAEPSKPKKKEELTPGDQPEAE